MTREQALNYLVSSGLTEEQVMEVVEALRQEPCEDTVSREAVLGLFAQNADAVRPYSAAWEKIRDLPSVNPQPKTGHWYVNEWGNITCSECGCTALYDKVYPDESVFGKAIRVKTTFCPTCGAKMIEPQEI